VADPEMQRGLGSSQIEKSVRNEMTVYVPSARSWRTAPLTNFENISVALSGFKPNKMKMVGQDVIPTHFAPKVDGCRAWLRVNDRDKKAMLFYENGITEEIAMEAQVCAVLEVEVVKRVADVVLVILDVLLWEGSVVYTRPLKKRIELMDRLWLFGSLVVFYQKYTDIDTMYMNRQFYVSNGIQIDGIVCVNWTKSYMLSTSKWKNSETLECKIRIDVKGCRAVIRDDSMEEDMIIGYLDNTTYRYSVNDVCEFDISGKELRFVRHRKDRDRSNSKLVYEEIQVFNFESGNRCKQYGLMSSLTKGMDLPDESFSRYSRRKKI